MEAICQRNNKFFWEGGILFNLAMAFLLVPVFCFGDVVISEIMYDPKDADSSSGGEWIEVHNLGPGSVDLTKWIFFENDTNHGISTDGAFEVPDGGYAVISSNLTFYKNFFTSYSGLLFKAAFSLNDGEPLALKNGKEAPLTSAVTYLSDWGAKNDGNSLQLSSGKWVIGAPTPGALNVSNNDNSPPPTTGGGNQPPATTTTATVASGTVGGHPVDPQIFTFIKGDNGAITGVDTVFSGSTIGLDKKPINGARYLWSFGDGVTKEGQTVSHTWLVPGNYLVILETSSGEFNAGARQKVSVTASGFSIDKIETGNNGFISIKNSLSADVNISRWILRSDGKTFIFPSPTLILADSSVPFLNGVTGLSPNPNNIELFYPNGTLAVKFEEKKEVIKTLASVSPPNIGVVKSVPMVKEEKIIPKESPKVAIIQEPVAPKEEVISSSTLIYASAVGGSGVYLDWVFALVGLVGIGVLGMVFSRGKRNDLSEDNQEAGAKTLTAEDFEIIEEKE